MYTSVYGTHVAQSSTEKSHDFVHHVQSLDISLQCLFTHTSGFTLLVRQSQDWQNVHCTVLSVSICSALCLSHRIPCFIHDPVASWCRWHAICKCAVIIRLRNTVKGAYSHTWDDIWYLEGARTHCWLDKRCCMYNMFCSINDTQDNDLWSLQALNCIWSWLHHG